MSFAILFNNDQKSIKKLKVEDFDPLSVRDKFFVWINFNLNEMEEMKTFLSRLGIQEVQIERWSSLNIPLFYWHSQNVLLEVLWYSTRQNQSIKNTPLLIAMTRHLIITGQEEQSPFLAQVLHRFEESFKTVGKSPGFIYFLFLDLLIDSYAPHLYFINEIIEEIESLYLNGKKEKKILELIIKSKGMVRTLKHSVSPVQRALRHLVNVHLELISREQHKYLQGLYENLDQISRAIDTLQERIHFTLEGYNSLLSQQINQSMKILTLIATIMMPLSLLAGIYGTNFRYIPELNWRYGYFGFLSLLFVLGCIMVIFFKKKRWI